MVSLRLLFLTTSLFVSQGYSQLTAPRPCCPTGPIIPVGQFIVPAMIKPLVTPCQPLLPCQPLPHCPPLPPPQPTLPCPPLPPRPPTLPTPPTHTSVKQAPCVEDDDDEEFDRIMCLLINNILENRKNSGKRTASTKGIDSDKTVDFSNNYVNCGDDYEYILPSPYAPYQTPAAATFYPFGAGADDRAPMAGAGDSGASIPVSGNCYAPEISLIFRPMSENC